MPKVPFRTWSLTERPARLPGFGHPLVLLEEHPVADAEGLGAEPDLLAELTAGLAPGPDHVVQGHHVGPADGQDGGGVVVVDGPPVLDQPVPGLVDGAGDGDPAVLGVGVDGPAGVSVSESDQGVAFPLLVGAGLAAVGGEGDDVGSELRARATAGPRRRRWTTAGGCRR